MKTPSTICLGVLLSCAIGAVAARCANAAQASDDVRNLALVATASTSYCSGHETIMAVNDGSQPADSNDKRHGAYGNWPQQGLQSVQYDWPCEISTGKIEVYWFSDGGGVKLPKNCVLKAWDGKAFVAVKTAAGLGVEGNKFNTTTFDEVKTSKLRLEFESNGASTGILEWRVVDSGKSPNMPPRVAAGADRVVVLDGKTYLSGEVKDDGKKLPHPTVKWSKQSGPGEVTFEEATAVVTDARFSAEGDYVLKLAADDGELTAADTLHVTAINPPPKDHLLSVATKSYKISSPLWRERNKKLICQWIPHCYDKCSDPKAPEGGIENFVEAGNKLAGRPFKPQKGAVFANAWVHNTVEAMCVALLLDPQGDEEIISAQKAIRAKLDDWIPKLLSAQEPDGYLQTCYTLGNLKRWSNKSDHEGYQAGYFIEAAIAHYVMTGKTDARMYNAARRLADCWVKNIGPAPKKAWYEGHQELELALVRLGRFVDENEGAGKGRQYIELAKFLMDSRGHGEEYDQSHCPVTQQYEAVGHAVRAVYSYTGMADLAMETGDTDYRSAVQSIFNNLVNRKYYITGGVGSGETSEGFGKDYSLPHNAYCESCSGCGELFFQHRLNMTWHDARYADLYEETLYNAILGDVDFAGKNFTYTNALDSSETRYPWHGCPCCIGNIPRTLLSLPSWIYVKGPKEICVNLFIGSTVTVEGVAGTDVEMVQETDYPWNGKVAITVNPKAAKPFTLKVRSPKHDQSTLYSALPAADGIRNLKVNGETVEVKADRGYLVLDRTWKAGDRVELELPLDVQRVKTVAEVKANRGRVALRRGPLVYNVEACDQPVDFVLGKDTPIEAKWRADLLGGMMVLEGQSANGKPFVAIPNYARNNRGGRSLVWIKDE